MTFNHFMGWALTWALGGACEWARAQTQALKIYWMRRFHHTECIEVVGLGCNLTRYARVVGPDRLLALMAYVGDMRCRLSS